MPLYDVTVHLRIRVRAIGPNKAEAHVLDMLEDHLSQMADSPGVIETGVPLTATNPHAAEVTEAQHLPGQFYSMRLARAKLARARKKI